MKKLRLILPLVLGFAQGPAMAASVDDLWAKELGANQNADVAVGSGTLLLRLWYVGSATESVVTITQNRITVFSPQGTRDTGFGLNGQLDLNVATTSTLGQLCSVIDGYANFECELLAGRTRTDARQLRDQATATSGTNDLKAGGGFSIGVDSAAATHVNGSTYVAVGLIPASLKYVRLRECSANINGGTAKLRVFGKLKHYEQAEGNALASPLDGAVRDDGTIAWDMSLTSNTTSTQTWAVGGKGGLDFATGSRVVVDGSSDDGAFINQLSSNFVRCIWEER